MLEYQFRPLNGWPGKLHTSRRYAPFKAGYAATLKLLEFELCCLQARQIVIQAAFSEHDIRNDGMPRGDRSPSHPGIVVSFNSPKGAMSFPCDTFTHWQDNLRAIALSLEALRKVNRYGVTRSDEQYRGWKQLPAPLVTPPPEMSADEAAKLLLKYAYGDKSAGAETELVTMLTDTMYARHVYRRAAANTHPDHTKGSDADFKKVQEARAVLKLENGQ